MAGIRFLTGIINFIFPHSFHTVSGAQIFYTIGTEVFFPGVKKNGA
jgi:hypothetical protein